MTGIAQRLDAEWDHLTARLRNQAPETADSSAPAPTTGNPLLDQILSSPALTPQENRMSFGTALHRIAAVAEKIGDDADEVLITLTDHPEGVAVLRAVVAAMGIPLPAGAIIAAANSFKVAVSAYEAGKATAQNGQQGGTTAQPAQVPVTSRAVV